MAMPHSALHLESSHERLELNNSDLIDRELDFNRIHSHTIHIIDLEAGRSAPFSPHGIAWGDQEGGREEGLPGYPKMARDI
jgi:hypothetical protein